MRDIMSMGFVLIHLSEMVWHRFIITLVWYPPEKRRGIQREFVIPLVLYTTIH